jgi:hypothetical protein
MVNRDLRTCGPAALGLIVAGGPRLRPGAPATPARGRALPRLPPAAGRSRDSRPRPPPATIWTSLPEAGIGLDQGDRVGSENRHGCSTGPSPSVGRPVSSCCTALPPAEEPRTVDQLPLQASWSRRRCSSFAYLSTSIFRTHSPCNGARPTRRVAARAPLAACGARSTCRVTARAPPAAPRRATRAGR